MQKIIARAAKEHIIAAAALHAIIARTAVQKIVAGRIEIQREVAFHVIVAGAAHEHVVARAALQHIIPIAPIEHIVAGDAHRIVRIVAVHKVVARAPHDRVVARTAVHGIVPLVTAQRVGAGSAVEEIVLRAAEDPVVPPAGENRVVARVAEQLVIPSPAGDEVAAPARMDQVVVVADGRGEPAGIRRGPGVVPLFIEERGVDRLEDGVAVQVGAHLHEVIHFLKLRARRRTEIRDDLWRVRQRDAQVAVGEVFYRQRAVDGQVVARDAIPLVGELIVQALVVRLAALLDPNRHQVLVIDDGALPIAAIPTRYGIRRVVHDDVMAITRVIDVQVLPRPSPQHIIAFAPDEDVVAGCAEDEIVLVSPLNGIATTGYGRVRRDNNLLERLTFPFLRK